MVASFNPQTPPTQLLPLTAPLTVQFVMVPLLLYPQTPPAKFPVEVTVPLPVQFAMVPPSFNPPTPPAKFPVEVTVLKHTAIAVIYTLSHPEAPPIILLPLTAPLPVQF